MTEANTLVVTFVADQTVLEPGEQFVFGRSGDLRLDEGDDRYLHRNVGRFFWFREFWWIENLGRTIDLVLRDEYGADDRILRPPQTPEPLLHLRGGVWLDSGARQYQLDFVQAIDPMPLTPRPAVVGGEETWDFGVAPLGEGQRRLLVALAEPRLRGQRGRYQLPSNEEVAERLGWSRTTFNRRLDGLCNLFSSLGVRGLVGDDTQKAMQRRELLVEHVLKRHMITRHDLPEGTQ